MCVSESLNTDSEINSAWQLFDTPVTFGGFYDGKDLYFFLQNETITIGDKEYKISPLSYVKVKYQEFIEIYNYDKDECIYIQDENIVKEDVIIKSQYYTLNLTTDSIKYGNSEQLLISNPNSLPIVQ